MLVVNYLTHGLDIRVVLIVPALSRALFTGVLLRYLREVVSNVERAGAVLLPGAEADIVYPCYDSGPMLSLIKSTRAVFTTLPDPEM